MFDFFKRRLVNEKGAMDRILVILLFIIIGVGAIVGLSGWWNTTQTTVETSATTAVTTATTDASSTSE